MDLTKKALVTGASEGIGRAFAKKIATQGYQITAVARNESRLKELIDELGGSPHTFLAADLSKEQGVQKVSAELKRTHYDLLVNNAGFGIYGKFHETSLERLREMTRLNCDALVTLCHVFLSEAKSGDALVNVSSTLAFLPMPISGLYSGTKAFVTAFTEALWYEQKPRGIYVMGLCPGITATNFQVRAGGKNEELPSALIQKPEQVVEAAVRALKRRKKPTVISGSKNAMMTAFTRFMPRKSVVSMMGKARER